MNWVNDEQKAVTKDAQLTMGWKPEQVKKKQV
jgi:hypothetical protein